MPSFIVITGRAAAGKSTLAAELSRLTGAEHVAIDDYDSWAQVAARISRSSGPLIVEGCRVPRRTLQAATAVVVVDAPRSVIERRLRARGWSQAHVASVLRERYVGSVRVDGTRVVDVATTLTHLV